MTYTYTFETAFPDENMGKFGCSTSAENLERIQQCPDDAARQKVHDEVREKFEAFVKSRIALPGGMLTDASHFTPDR